MTQFVLKGITQPWVVELRSGSNRLGRDTTNDFPISDVSVSGFHCEIIVSQSSATVRDLGSTNGTFIDGEPIQERVIRSKQTLRLGNAELRLEAEIPQVTIPTLSVPQAVIQTYLPDGTAACLNHPGRGATHQCTRCEHLFCGDCVRVLGLEGGQSMIFCPVCTAQCEPMTEKAIESAQRQRGKKPSFFGRLTKTLSLAFKRKP